ncbi:HlyD family efflux transporter periplasmic adaptor subunit [Alkaliphilus serpentinus]|uniref:HlyD family efflux transporter periplasmic adaptor subunit n=1 Tax=Alkaliphilus serpentinus TaxID=1482731 RepID=A0A833MAW2_9FIRM|nr:HlyD family efflux transporter periplasmic adaptor subunit [Alkaliphilus serpentinus]KAB3531778.1 HlyD family efflux transporter periplasmic adaptor subunit [Alkaliphilus serpentinus]
MKGIIQDIKDLTDSRELLLSKPHPFISIFIYLLIIIITTATLWTYFGEMDIYIKTSGVVRPSETVSTITNKVSGNIIEIHYSEGKKVQLGDLLYIIDNSQMILERDAVAWELKIASQELGNLIKFSENIDSVENPFNKDVEEEEDYYYKFLKYRTDYDLELKRLELESNRVELDINQYTYLSKQLDNLIKLRESIIVKSNLFGESNSIFYTKYEIYRQNIEELETLMAINENEYEVAKVLFNSGGISKKELEDKENTVKQMDLDLKKYKNDYSLSVYSSIEEIEVRLRELRINILNNEVGLEVSNLTPEKHKIDTLIQIDDKINSLLDKVERLEKDLEKHEIAIKDSRVSSPRDGTVNVNVELSEGDYLQNGIEVLTIVPETGSKFKVQLFVSNKDIASIKVGDEVKYHFQALPYREYGELTGEITSISTDAKIDNQRTVSYYIVEASIDNKPLYSYKGARLK